MLNANGFPLGRDGGVVPNSWLGDGGREITGLVGAVPWMDEIFHRGGSRVQELRVVDEVPGRSVVGALLLGAVILGRGAPFRNGDYSLPSLCMADSPLVLSIMHEVCVSF